MSDRDWRDGLKSTGLHYFGGIVSNPDEVLERHKIATQSCFGTRSSAKKATTQVSLVLFMALFSF